MSPRVLITGATGFAGGFLVEHYLERGWSVHGTTRGIAEEDTSWLTPEVDLTTLDLCDAEAVDTLIERARPEVVCHLAAQSSVSRSWEDPLATVQVNVGAQYNLLTAVSRRAPEARVLVVGSCDEYGNVRPDENPVSESQELRPTNPYALSKVAQDLMGYQFAAGGLHVVRVRPFLQLGPRRPSLFATGSFARQMAEIEAGLREAVMEVGNLDLVRDFTDVRDMARAYALAVERGSSGEVYNMATGEGHSLRDVLSAMVDAASVRPEIRQRPELLRSGEPEMLTGDASRLEQLTAWTPRISLAQSARDSLDYWRDRVRLTAASR